MRAYPIPGANSRRVRPDLPGALAVAFALLLTAGGLAPANAEVYRCVGADGRVTFTDDRSACPGADRHALQPRIQRVVEGSGDPPTVPAAPVRRNTASTAEEDEAQQRQWQAKKQRAAAELEALEGLTERLERSVIGCNRGLDIFVRDRDTGIKNRLSCDELLQKYADIKARSRQLHEYLETGLQQECRRAGCLPGWIR